MTATAVDLRDLDQAHLLHPQHHPSDHADPLIFTRGEGASVWTVDGQRYIDGLSGLWNVNVGHGRRELADAAQQQMANLAFTSAYVGSSNPPAIELAARVARLAGPSLNTVFFTTGGAESNETSFKAAWFFWSMQGKPEKRKILSRSLGYHGVTMGAGSATGLPVFWKHFGPQPPGFSHIPNLDPDALEAQIVAEGPDTVAAFIGEPVQGAGGVIPPPADYWPRIREICSKYDVLLIADEVITGFGR
ncbi:MAG: aspartate aminotransferase family protein, partial [Dehalococcoidia bacterium]|nr:aspartate aminotransferase family protein [Dehalococcoidia bacterium]